MTTLPITVKKQDLRAVVDMVQSRPMNEQLEWLEGSLYTPPANIELVVHTFGSYHAGRTVYGKTGQHATPAAWVCIDDDAKKPTPPADAAPCDAVKSVGKHAVKDAKGPLKFVYETRKAMQARAKKAYATPGGVDPVVSGLWNLMADGSISPKAGWTALAVLTQASELYALGLAKHVAMATSGSLLEEGCANTTTATSDAPEHQPCLAVATPTLKKRRVAIANETEGVVCWVSLVEATRRLMMSSQENGGKPVACGPAADLCGFYDDENADGSAEMQLHPLTPPVQKVLGWVEWLLTNPYTKRTMQSAGESHIASLKHFVEAGGFAAASDPLVATLQAVDVALTKRIVSYQQYRYDFAWFSPQNWFNPLLKLVGWKHKPLPLTQLPADASFERYQMSNETTPNAGELPYLVPEKESSLVHVLSQTFGRRELAEWLHAYAHAAAACAAEVSAINAAEGGAADTDNDDRSLGDVMASILSVGLLTCTGDTVGRWMKWRPSPSSSSS